MYWWRSSSQGDLAYSASVWFHSAHYALMYLFMHVYTCIVRCMHGAATNAVPGPSQKPGSGSRLQFGSVFCLEQTLEDMKGMALVCGILTCSELAGSCAPRTTGIQIGARIGWNPIDAATQPPTGTRERVRNLFDSRTDHRNLGFEDSCLSIAPPSFSRRFGQVVDDGGNRFCSRHACRWMAHSQVRQSEHGDWIDIGLWPRIALDCRIRTVLTLSVALLFYGAMAGSMDVAMNTHAVMLEKRYQRHIMSSFHALFSLGGMAGSCVRGIGCFTCGSGRSSLLGERHRPCRSVHTRIQVASASLSI